MYFSKRNLNYFVMALHSKIIIILLLLGFVLTPCLDAKTQPIIRVAIVNDVVSATIKISTRFEIKTLEGKALHTAGHLKKTNIYIKDGQIRIGKLSFGAQAIKIIPSRQDLIYINRRRYRGTFTVMKKDNNLLIVNNVNLEDYLRGVLCFEISYRWPFEAIKAHAVTSRTFALYQMDLRKGKDFDATNDIYSQVYVGKSHEKWRINRAINSTKGEVLLYNGKNFPAFFHAACAGHTEDASQLWNIDIPPLKGVTCEYCFGTKHYSWQKEISLADIAKKLKAVNPEISQIKNIKAVSRNNSLRVVELEITIDEGKTVLLSAKDFRQALGPNLIRSTNFYLIQDEPGIISFAGKGWGHGVGLCQWGSYNMARKGFRYREILELYYPEATIKRDYK